MQIKIYKEALNKNNEVFNFLSSICNKYGIGFWKPGAGIIHQVVLRELRFPWWNDDWHPILHTVNAGALGMVAAGVGGEPCSRRNGRNGSGN